MKMYNSQARKNNVCFICGGKRAYFYICTDIHLQASNKLIVQDVQYAGWRYAIKTVCIKSYQSYKINVFLWKKDP